MGLGLGLYTGHTPLVPFCPGALDLVYQAKEQPPATGSHLVRPLLLINTVDQQHRSTFPILCHCFVYMGLLAFSGMLLA